MSFKRDGDDAALLHNLRKHRVDELLTLHIPDDEAILLKNGRYSCSVCRHRPIFDTINVLAIHRKGKKHLRSLTERLKIENDRRLQSQSQSQPEQQPQPASSVYKSCRKALIRAKPSPYSRKQTLIVKDKAVASVPINQPRMPTKSIINQYVSSIQKKTDFVSFVEKTRSGMKLPSSLACPDTSFFSKKEKKCQSKIEKRPEIELGLSLREKGWIKNDDGTWGKEDGVEFDSDDDSPNS